MFSSDGAAGNQLPPNYVPNPDQQGPLSIGPSLQSLPISPDDLAAWWERVDAARNRIKNREHTWDTLLKEYLPLVVGYNEPETIKVNAHFRNVHTKLPKLFFRTPDLILEAEGPLKDPVIDPVTGIPLINPLTMQPVTAEDVAIIKQAVLKKKLGLEPAGINAVRLMDELLFDALAFSGVAPSKIGYRAVVETIQQPVLDPLFGTPIIDPMTGQPVLQPVPVTIWEEWYWTRFSPKKLLLADDLHSTRVDQQASWVGMEFAMTEDEARRTFGVSAEVSLTDDDDRRYIYAEDSNATKGKKLIRGVEIWLKASIFDPTVKNPLRIRQLVLLDGNRELPALYRDDPDQTFDEFGKITPDSRIGFPIHVLTLRDLTDSPFPPADSAFTNSQAKHLNTHRQQSSKLRDANIGKFFFDEGAFAPDEIEKIRTGEPGSWHGVQSGRLQNGADKIVAQVTQANQSRDDWRLAQVIKDDMDETLGLPRSEAGMTETGETTATEIATSSSKAAERLEKEQSRALEFFLTGVRKFDALLQRYADEADFVQIVGMDGAKRLQAWNRKVIAGAFAYDAKPDSQLRIDAAKDRAQLLAFYQQTVADPMVDRRPIIKKLAQYFGLDPSKVVVGENIMQMMGLAGMTSGAAGMGGMAGTGNTAMPGGAPTGQPAPGGNGTGRLPNEAEPGTGTTQVQNQMGRR